MDKKKIVYACDDCRFAHIRYKDGSVHCNLYALPYTKEKPVYCKYKETQTDLKNNTIVWGSGFVFGLILGLIVGIGLFCIMSIMIG